MRDPFERVHKQAAQSLQPALCAIASALRGKAPPASYDDTHRDHLADELRQWANGPFGLQLVGTALTPPDERAAALCSTDASSSDDDWSDVDLAEMTLERYATLPLHTSWDGLGLSGQACTLFPPPSPTSSDEVILSHEPYEEYFAVHAPGGGPDEEDAAAMEEEEMRRYRAFGVPPLTPRLALLVGAQEEAVLSCWERVVVPRLSRLVEELDSTPSTQDKTPCAKPDRRVAAGSTPSSQTWLSAPPGGATAPAPTSQPPSRPPWSAHAPRRPTHVPPPQRRELAAPTETSPACLRLDGAASLVVSGSSCGRHKAAASPHVPSGQLASRRLPTGRSGRGGRGR